ncbi:MAG: H-NS histone family protein [Proteobacteria bacterium]|nr:H-NS histone family protein [Pseudomonadota bacterium]
MSAIQELLARRADLDRQIMEAQRAAKSDAIAKVKALMTEGGLTVADLQFKSEGGSGRRASAAAGRKVAAKYRNNATGDTWTGRGLKPKWLQAQLAAGKTLADFAV